jgi:hypothetical protein
MIFERTIREPKVIFDAIVPVIHEGTRESAILDLIIVLVRKLYQRRSEGAEEWEKLKK